MGWEVKGLKARVVVSDGSKGDRNDDEGMIRMGTENIVMESTKLRLV